MGCTREPIPSPLRERGNGVRRPHEHDSIAPARTDRYRWIMSAPWVARCDSSRRPSRRASSYCSGLMIDSNDSSFLVHASKACSRSSGDRPWRCAVRYHSAARERSWPRSAHTASGPPFHKHPKRLKGLQEPHSGAATLASPRAWQLHAPLRRRDAGPPACDGRTRCTAQNE